MYDVDYLALMSKPRTSPEAEISRSLKRAAGSILLQRGLCPYHLNKRMEKERTLERTSKLHKAYRKKKRSW